MASSRSRSNISCENGVEMHVIFRSVVNLFISKLCSVRGPVFQLSNHVPVPQLQSWRSSLRATIVAPIFLKDFSLLNSVRFCNSKAGCFQPYEQKKFSLVGEFCFSRSLKTNRNVTEFRIKTCVLSYKCAQ